MSAGHRLEFHVVEAERGLRLDKWLSQQDGISSRSRAAELIAQGRVRLNGTALKASTRVQPAWLIVVDVPTPTSSQLEPWAADLDVVFEDDDLIVVNKPSGLVMHPAAGHAQDTLVNILLHHTKRLSMGFNEQRPGIVHRLDRDTSGLLVVAKNDESHHALARQFREKTAHRVYWALVHGIPKRKDGTIRSYLARHPSDRKRFASSGTTHGKHAITHYHVIQSVPAEISWVSCRLETGRTHQIRVHMSESGHPLLGDPIYGRNKRTKDDLAIGRLGLHACELGFAHPRTGERLTFARTWPEALAAFARTKGFKDVSG